MSEKPHILVIDDDNVMRLSIQLALADKDWLVDYAENGVIGIKKLKADHYDLVLLDLMMPELRGEKVLKEIEKIDTRIIIIVITGYASVESAIESMKTGAYDYLPKPFTPDELRQAVRKGLSRRQLMIETEDLRQEREKNLMRLAAEQSRLTTIINCMGEGLIATDFEGILLLINPIARKLLWLDDSFECGQRITGLLNCRELEKLIMDTLQSQKLVDQYFRTEITFDEKSGIVYAITMASIVERPGEISGLALVIHDISEQKKLEKMKAEFQKLVSVVTHELKAPINTIEGYLVLLLKGFVKDDTEKQMEYLTRARQKAEMLRHLIQDLLSITSIESGKITQQMKPIDVRTILTELITFMEIESKAKEIKIVPEFANQLAFVQGDQNALNYLFTNLISNAIKYNKIEGTITIKAFESDDFVVVSVIDTGLGISEEDQKKIFTEFYRSPNQAIQKITGTGLGLNITKRIADLHNGFLQVSSQLGEGSQFDVYLPKIKTKQKKRN
jgi:two-component system, OmpR family, phosphate regulon sensor histidine kinase PhoR